MDTFECMTKVSAFRYGNPAVSCDGAEVSALCRQLATVVSISGELNEANLPSVTGFVTRYVLREKPIVLDVAEVSTASDGVLALLYAIDDASDAAGVEWAVVASPAVLRVLRRHGDPADFHTVDSVPAALHHFATSSAARRRLLPILSKSA